MQPVGVLGGVDALQDSVGVEVLGQRQLHDVSVARGIGVELVDDLGHLFLGGIRRQLDLHRIHADRLGLAVLHPDVQLGCRVGADQHRRDPGRDAAGLQRRDPFGQFRLDRRRRGLAVQCLRRHGGIPFVVIDASSIARNHYARR